MITGASAGLGTVFARRLAAQKHDLLLVARRADRLHELAAELRTAHGVQAEEFAADLATDAGIAATAERIRGEDRLTMLVNNAGFGTKGRFWEATLASQEAMHQLHVMATMRLTHAALQGMVRRDRGAIINVSSVSAFVRAPGNVSYGSTKTWMTVFTEALYLELKAIRSNVHVQALCPGYTITDFHPTMGVDRGNVPKSWWMNAEDVVNASLDGLRRDNLFVIPGLRYRMVVALMTKLPAALRVALERRSPQSKGRV